MFLKFFSLSLFIEISTISKERINIYIIFEKMFIAIKPHSTQEIILKNDSLKRIYEHENDFKKE